jgi:hypothetical protein
MKFLGSIAVTTMVSKVTLKLCTIAYHTWLTEIKGRAPPTEAKREQQRSAST